MAKFELERDLHYMESEHTFLTKVALSNELLKECVSSFLFPLSVILLSQYILTIASLSPPLSPHPILLLPQIHCFFLFPFRKEQASQ